MNISTTRFLQQENIRLQKENEALEKKNQALNRYLDMVKDLYWTSQQIVTEENPLEVLDQLLYQVMDVSGAQDGSLSRLDEETGELMFVLVHGGLGQQLPGYRIKSDVSIAGWVVDNHKPIIVNNPRQDWRFSEEVDEEFGFSTRSILSVPIIMPQDKLMGVIQLVNKRDDDFTEADVALVLMLAQVAAAVLAAMGSQLTAGEVETAE